jgi:glycosyltransferase involved in cell wall biosynthesis
VDFWDVDAMADAIYGLLAYPGLAKFASQYGLNEVNTLKWENAAFKLKQIYEEVKR